MIVLALVLLLFAAVIAVTMSRDIGLLIALFAVVLLVLAVFAGVDFH